MNSLERIMATVQGQPVDRRAVSPILPLYGAKLTGCALPEYYTDPAAYARGQSAVADAFQPDVLFGPFALPVEGAAFGSEVRFFENQAPNLKSPVVSSADDLGQVDVPDVDSNPPFTVLPRSDPAHVRRARAARSSGRHCVGPHRPAGDDPGH